MKNTKLFIIVALLTFPWAMFLEKYGFLAQVPFIILQVIGFIILIVKRGDIF